MMIADTAPVRTTDAPATAIADMDCCALHQGGKIAATAFASARACSEIVAMMAALTNSKAPACNQAELLLAGIFGAGFIGQKIWR